jgi:predicted enzyme related to lactoylglutathione lyase
MPEKDGYEPGTPMWIDIGTDVEGAKEFYGGLFGWEAQEAGPPEETGGYGFFTKNGKLVAGFGPQQSHGAPYWTTYIAATDADDITRRVEANGGTAVVEPMDVMTAGRMAVFQDSEGAFFAVWQPGDHKGAQLVNEPGTFYWAEYNARDTHEAERFYTGVFGWGVKHSEGGPMPYTEWQLGGHSVAGMMKLPDGLDVPAHWLVYFAVEDTDAAVAKTKELFGSVVVPPMDSPAGAFSVLTDRQGATFAVITPSAAG